MRTYGPLYAKASTGKIKTWKITALELNDLACIDTEHGYIDGKITSSRKIVKPKNIGKSNQTSPYEQACLDARSKYNKKVDEGYVEDISELDGQELVLPMLAHSYTKRKHNIQWPAFCQPKLNGVRCLARMTENDPEYISRKGKKYDTLDHLNQTVEFITCALKKPLDGEIFNPRWSFQEIIRAVKKDRGEATDELEYWVYDVVDTERTFEERIAKLHEIMILEKGHWKPGDLIRIGKVILVPTIEVASEEEMMKWHKKWTKYGFEGTIVRNKEGLYELKNRSKDLQKYKDFLDSEYKIIGVHEATGNDKGTAVFELETKEGLKFRARPKGSRDIRKQYLDNMNNIIGKEATVQYQELSEAPEGCDEGVPIFPVVVSVRNYE